MLIGAFVLIAILFIKSIVLKTELFFLKRLKRFYRRHDHIRFEA